MSDYLHRPDADTAIHTPDGAVKLHTDPEDHLARLLAPETEFPWYVSLFQSIKELIHPTALPPLEITSRPVAVKDIWGLYAGDPKSRYYSLGIHVGVFALLWFGFTNPTVQKAIKQNFNLIDPNIKPYVPDVKPKQNTMQGGGGGGAREPLPVSKGRLPRPAMKQFVPPMIVDHTPKLRWIPPSSPRPTPRSRSRT